MKIIRSIKQKAEIIVSLDELILISNCINEAMELQEEFQTRTGYSLVEAQELISKIKAISQNIEAEF